MDKYICFRDDDTNFYTKVEELEKAYGKYWGEIPIMLACVPFVHGACYQINKCAGKNNSEKIVALREWEMGADSDTLTEYHKLSPLGDNEELVSTLRKLIEEKKVSIAQHGITHRFYDDGPEMLHQHYAYQFLRDGKEYLEKIFEMPINIFVPPSNTIDYKSTQYLRKLNMCMFSGGTITYRDKAQQIKRYLTCPSDVRDFLINNKKGITAYRIRQGIEIFNGLTFNVGEDAHSFILRLEKNLETNKGAVIGSHYFALCSDDEYREQYHKVMDYACKKWNIVLADEYRKHVG